MARIPTTMLVVALAARDAKGRLLLQQRPAGKHHAGLWEFPGGKVELSENAREALVREIAEELTFALDPADLTPAGFAEGVASDGVTSIVLLLYTCRDLGDEIAPREGQEWGWFEEETAITLPLAPMDAQLLAGLSAKAIAKA